MKQKGVAEIRKEISYLSREFNLRHDPQWFKYIFVSKEDNILLEYLQMCPDPIYNKFGNTLVARINNIKRFLDSAEFQRCLNRFGGQVISKDNLKRLTKAISKIGDIKLKNRILITLKKIKTNLGFSPKMALLTEVSNKRQRNQLLTFILRHEWIHILLNMNNINFQTRNKNYWKYDEGIVAYMEGFLDNNLNLLKQKAKKMKYSLEKQGYIHAIKFRQLLKNKNNPVERRKALLRLMANLR